MTGVVVELAGPAGAGKTTLARQLERSAPWTTLTGTARGPLVKGMATVVPSLAVARASRGGRWWTRDELRALAYLAAWRDEVSRRRGSTDLLFDHGPVFRLTRLAADAPPMASAPAFQRLWLRLAEQWAGLLGAVVWLDAPDGVLLSRVTGRDRPHRLVGLPPRDAAAFLDTYREAYARTLGVLRREGVRVLRFDTSTCSREQLTQQVTGALENACRP